MNSKIKGIVNSKKKKLKKPGKENGINFINSVVSLANRFVNYSSRFNLNYMALSDSYLLYQVRSFKSKKLQNRHLFEEIKKTFDFNANLSLRDSSFDYDYDDEPLFN